MKLAIVSDTHANLPAFKAVLDHIATQNIDKKVHLGDLVGYMPYPNECVELTLSNFDYIILGNHDEAATDLTKSWGFNPMAKEAIEWTASNLTIGNMEVLENLQSSFVLEDNLLFIHGSPARSFDYIFEIEEARRGFSASSVNFQVAFVGHTHVPAVFTMNKDGEVAHHRIRYSSSEGVSSSTFYIENSRAIINVGSVGQPRDNDNRASYAIFDTETYEVTHFKIPYSVDRTIGKMQQAGFSTNSYMRLLYGR